MKINYLYLALPLVVLWLSFGVVEWLDLTLVDKYEYVASSYVQTQEGGWYGQPYLITSFILFVGSIFLAGFKGFKND